MEKEYIVEKISELKKERNAVILAHNYQIDEVQDVADFVGDSLELSQMSAKLEADVIVFCGVHFMAETAAILAPEKTILIPEIGAGCPMADMITGSEMKAWKKKHPGKKVVCYINTSAEVKAECDVCCTSSNAPEIVEAVDSDEILFAPDKNLGAYVAGRTDKKIIPWDGYCYVHNEILLKHIKEKRQKYPDAEVWVHPECRPEVIDAADKVFSTGKMNKEARKTEAKSIILGTENGIIHRLKKENPDKEFYPAKDNAFCSNMKKINLKKVLISLQEMIYKVEVPPEISRRARGAIEKMVSL
jgi:quinolinate synthase